jgi:hypothetical protein
MKKTVVRDYYVLPCCLLILNLGVELVQYKARDLADPMVVTALIMSVVLFGGSLMAFVVAPALSWLVSSLYSGSRKTAGGTGEVLFLVGLGALIFWLYYRVYILGPQSILPPAWRNH